MMSLPSVTLLRVLREYGGPRGLAAGAEGGAEVGLVGPSETDVAEDRDAVGECSRQVGGADDVSFFGPSDFGVGIGLNELTRVHVESSAVEVDGSDEAVQVSIAGGTSFEGHDFAVESLGDGVGDVMAAVVHDVVQAFADHLRDLLDRFQPAADGPRVPTLEELASGGGSRVMPQVAEMFFENPGAARFQEVDGERLQLLAA